MHLPLLLEEYRLMMTEDVKDLVRAFNANAVKYLIVDGHAFGVNARPRTTKDLDLFIRSDAEREKAVFRALPYFGAPIAGITAADGMTFELCQPLERIDILQKIDDLAFDEAWENRIQGTVDGEVHAAVVSRDDLIRNRLASGHEQDLLDVKQLRRAPEAMKREAGEK